MSAKNKDTAKSGWVTPRITEAGTVAEILKGGGGKTSIVEADTGDVRKPKGQG